MISSNTFSNIFYNPDSKILKLTFRNNNKTYSFKNVPNKLFDDFKNAHSLGSFYHRHIKGKYNNSADGIGSHFYIPKSPSSYFSWT